MAKWHEYFREVLNRLTEEDAKNSKDEDIEEENDRNAISTEEPTTNEVKAAIRNLKNGKASGVDNILAEIIKADRDIVASMLTPLIANIWR